MAASTHSPPGSPTPRDATRAKQADGGPDYSRYKFPRGHILNLAFTLFANALGITLLFPFVGFMVEGLGMTHDRREVGWYAGYIAAAFMIGRVCSSYLWGRLSDSKGRRPCLYYGLASVALFSTAFGFSFSYYWAVVTRFFLGLGNSISGAAKTAVSELCSAEDQARAMALPTSSWGIGLVTGAALGGLLSRPAKTWPDTLSQDGLFGQFPYLLPNVVASVVAMIAAWSLWYFEFPETLGMRLGLPVGGVAKARRATESATDPEMVPLEEELDEDEEEVALPIPKVRSTSTSGIELTNVGGGSAHADPRQVRKVKGGKQSRRYAQLGSTDADAESLESSDSAEVDMGVQRGQEPRLPLWKRPSVRMAVGVYTTWSMLHILIDEAFPLWAIAPEAAGGLGMEATHLGSVMVGMGVAMLLFQVLVFPAIAKRLSPTRMVCIGAFALVPVLSAVPLVSNIPASSPVLQWCALTGIMGVKNAIGMVVFTSNFMLINNSVPADMRGAVNGCSMSFGSVGKAVGPAVGATLVAWSLTNGQPWPLNYFLPFVVCALLSLVCGLYAMTFPHSLNGML